MLVSGREKDMNSEEKKVAVCVKVYGKNAEEQCKKKRSNENWKIITDGQLFQRSIFCSSPLGEEWKPEDYQTIGEELDFIWEECAEEGHYIIEQNFETLPGEAGDQAVYLKLAYIALLGDRTKKSFVKAVMDVAYYKKSGIWAEEDILKALRKELVPDWGERLTSIFKEHFGDKHGGMVSTEKVFRNNAYYIRNARNQEKLRAFFGDED